MNAGDHSDLTGDVIVTARTEVAVDVVELTLTAVDGAEFPSWAPGSHVDVTPVAGWPRPDPAPTRSYSLVGDPTETRSRRVAVLRVPGGAVSGHLHDRTPVGSRLVVSAARPSFPLAIDGAEHVLVAGGIGITPVVSMALELVRQGRSTTVHHIARTPAHLAYAGDLAGFLADDYRPHLTGGPGGRRPRLADIVGEYRPGRQLYMCGPQPLVSDALSAAATAGWPSPAVHRESFGARTRPGDRPLRVQLALSGTEVTVAPGTTLLDALVEAGAWIPYDCRRGECCTCRVRVLAGRPDHRDVCRAGGDDDLITTCVSWAHGDVLVLEA
jgi:vanillate O-demethylase ferredoxin subunit